MYKRGKLQQQHTGEEMSTVHGNEGNKLIQLQCRDHIKKVELGRKWRKEMEMLSWVSSNIEKVDTCVTKSHLYWLFVLCLLFDPPTEAQFFWKAPAKLAVGQQAFQINMGSLPQPWVQCWVTSERWTESVNIFVMLHFVVIKAGTGAIYYSSLKFYLLWKVLKASLMSE